MIDSGRRVLLFSSIGHALMHMMTAFYAVIVLTLAVSWKLPPEDLLRLYAPATILLGVVSLPAGWLSDRFGAPAMMVVMFLGLGLSSIACGLVPTGDTLTLSLALCGIGAFGAFYHSVGIGWVIRTAREQGHAMAIPPASSRRDNTSRPRARARRLRNHCGHCPRAARRHRPSERDRRAA